MPRTLYNPKTDAEKAKIIKAADEGNAIGASLESVARHFKIGESTAALGRYHEESPQQERNWKIPES